MGLKCGIVGLPNVGKSTLFNALSGARVEASNFPFCTIEPNLGVVKVPDPRLKSLADIVEPEKIIPAIIEFVDIAGLVQGASNNEGLGNKFLANIREVDTIIHVVRCFENENIVHVAGSVDPVFDKGIIDNELQIKDLETVEKRIERIEKLAKSGDKVAKKSLDIFNILKKHLQDGNNLRSLEISKEDLPIVQELNLLTIKPVLYIANVDEASITKGNKHTENLQDMVARENAPMIIISAGIEAEIAELEENERNLFLEEYGLKDSGLNQLIRVSYDLLELITYFTAGVKEVRAWTIKKGFKAPQAAGVIHTDFEKGFIRAEVIGFDNYIRLGSELACKEAGKMALEGKEYIVKDGDIMHFRFNV